MSYFLLAANLLTFIAFFLHALAGDREVKHLEPGQNSDLKLRTYWTMTRCGWHWISIDLLGASLLLALLNFSSLFTHPTSILNLMALYFLGYAVVWAFTIAISKSFPKNFLLLGQWMLLLVISGLIYAGTEAS